MQFSDHEGTVIKDREIISVARRGPFSIAVHTGRHLFILGYEQYPQSKRAEWLKKVDTDYEFAVKRLQDFS